MPYLGNTPSTSFATVVKDSFNGGSTAYTLSKVATTNSVSVFVENVRQEPTTAYAVSGTTLTFTASTPSGTGNIYVLHMNPTTTTTHPAAQNLTAVDGTFTGNIDVDGTANLDVVDIDGAVDMASTLAVAGVSSLTNKLTVLAADGTVDNDWVMDVRNNEATDDRSYGLRVSAGSTSTDRALDILDHAQANTLLRVNGAGTVTMPKQPCFRARRTNTAGTTQGFTSNIIFDSETLDLGSNYNTSNGRFTAPVDGTYYFSHAGLGASGSGAAVHSSGASWHLEFLLNGTRTGFQFYWYQGNPSAGGNQTGYINSYMDMVITLNANDYITVQLPDGTDSYYSDTSTYYDTYFQGFLIG